MSEVTSGVSLIPGRSRDFELKTQEDVALSGQINEGETSQRGDDSETETDPCDRESSILRNVEAEPTRVCRILYPVDALPSTKAQKWLPQAFAYNDVNLGPEYLDLLLEWIDFERIHQWEKSGGHLDKAERLREITAWIMEGRYLPCCKGPKLEADFVKTFPGDMCKWWTSLNQVVDFDRTGLLKYGINGWFSIVAGMKWWGQALKCLSRDSLRNDTEEWLMMIMELTETLGMLKKGCVKEQSSNLST
ncbi:SERTA domain-containing protein 3 [Stygiomarasmius scandens]|uniref:SERTA domain-containing protein 3 n=1 Tax=Marasmiellus scandens TaxID=2682957 RepID=A0ABR1JH37_9AGAR